MKVPPPVSFRWLMETLADAKCQVRVLETIWFSAGLAEAWTTLQSFSFSVNPLADRPTMKEVISLLQDQRLPSASVLYRTGIDFFLRPVSDLRVVLERKSTVEQLDLMQLLPMRYQHRYLHVINLRCRGGEYECHYTLLLRSSQHLEGSNERTYRKLKSEATRLVQMIEASAGLRVLGGKFSFIISDGVPMLQNVEECVLVQSHLLSVFSERTSVQAGRAERHIRGRLLTNRELVSGARSVLASPLRIRTPEMARAESPRSSVEKLPHLPHLSPSRFNHHFKELVAKTFERTHFNALCASRKLSTFRNIEELVRDDEKFFELMGLKEGKEEMKKSASEVCISTVSTNESASREAHAPPQLTKFLSSV